MNWRLLSFPTISISLGLALALGLMLGLRSYSTHATTVAAICVENPSVKITKGSGVNKLEVTIRDGCENIAFKGKPVKGEWYLSKNTRKAARFVEPFHGTALPTV